MFKKQNSLYLAIWG